MNIEHGLPIAPPIMWSLHGVDNGPYALHIIYHALVTHVDYKHAHVLFVSHYAARYLYCDSKFLFGLIIVYECYYY